MAVLSRNSNFNFWLSVNVSSLLNLRRQIASFTYLSADSDNKLGMTSQRSYYIAPKTDIEAHCIQILILYLGRSHLAWIHN